MQLPLREHYLYQIQWIFRKFLKGEDHFRSEKFRCIFFGNFFFLGGGKNDKFSEKRGDLDYPHWMKAIELELNSIFVQKTSLYCLIMLCNVGVVVEQWGKWWPGKCGNVDWEKYLSNLVQKPGNWSMTFRKVTATAWMVNRKNSDKFPATLGMCRPTFARF